MLSEDVLNWAVLVREGRSLGRKREKALRVGVIQVS